MNQEDIMNRDVKIQGGISQIEEKLKTLEDEQMSLRNQRVLTNCRLKTPDMSSDLNLRTLMPVDLLYLKGKLMAIHREVGNIYAGGFLIENWVKDIDYLFRFTQITNDIVRLKRLKDSLTEYYSEDKKISDSVDSLINSI